MSNNESKTNTKKIRPPVVVVLGHVDHGKTSLLDTIRETKVVEKESGGITQHIGAYQTEVKAHSGDSGQDTLITFLDTPGHEAFTAIRSRGAKVADIGILVIAADESVKPQTKEAIKIMKDEKISIIVAINKIDKAGANVQKVKQNLASEDVLVEDWGGKVPVVEISVKQNKNIDDLLDMIVLVAELEDFKEDLSLPAKGLIIESNMDKGKGSVATVLIQKGTLTIGDWIVAGTVTGKVKAMEDFLSKPVTKAVPSQPVKIVGWNSAPAIGKEFQSASSKNEADNIAADNTDLAPLFSFFKGENTQDTDTKVLKIIFKTDVSSSLEAIESALGAIKSEDVKCQVLNYDIGNISESDVKMAVGSNALIVGFRVKVDNSAKKVAEKDNVSISTFDVIYELIEYIRKEMENLLEPEIRKNELGKIKILAVFKTDSKSQIIGGKVTSGKVKRGALADVIRNNSTLITGRITQLQHNKNDTSEVNEGSECGMKFEPLKDQGAWDIKEGDILEVYEEEKISRSL